METTDQKRLRNLVTVFICFLAIAIMVDVSKMYDQAHRPMRTFVVRRIHDTTYVARPVTVVLNNKSYEVSLAPVRYTEEKFTPIVDNGDIAKAKRQELRHDRAKDR